MDQGKRAAKRRGSGLKHRMASAPPATFVRAKHVPTTSPLVLVVDDLEDNRDIYGTYFEYAGFRVARAEDGEQALAKVTVEKPDLIVMDLCMPQMDGWEATRMLKSNPRTKGIVIVVV